MVGVVEIYFFPTGSRTTNSWREWKLVTGKWRVKLASTPHMGFLMDLILVGAVVAVIATLVYVFVVVQPHLPDEPTPFPLAPAEVGVEPPPGVGKGSIVTVIGKSLQKNASDPFGEEDELSYIDDYIVVSGADARKLSPGMHLCIGGRSHRVAHISPPSDDEATITLLQLLDQKVLPGDVVSVGDCPGNPWKPGPVDAVAADPKDIVVTKVIASYPRTLGVSRADGAKFSVSDVICVNGLQHIVESVSSGSESVDLITVTLPFNAPPLEGMIFRKGLCASI